MLEIHRSSQPVARLAMFAPIVIRHRFLLSTQSPIPATSLRQHNWANGRRSTIRCASFGPTSIRLLFIDALGAQFTSTLCNFVNRVFTHQPLRAGCGAL